MTIIIDGTRALEVAREFFADYSRCWQQGDASGVALLYANDAVLIGAAVAAGRTEIQQAIGGLLSQGWVSITIEPRAAHALGDVIFVAARYVATGIQGRRLEGSSSWLLAPEDSAWRAAAHHGA